MPLRYADTSHTRRFEDGAAWLVLRTEVTKGDQDAIEDLNSRYSMPADFLDGTGTGNIEIRPNAKEIRRLLFDILAQSWSVSEGEPSAADYDRLDQESGRWVDQCVNEALAEYRERRGKKASSSKRRATSRASSPQAAAST